MTTAQKPTTDATEVVARLVTLLEADRSRYVSGRKGRDLVRKAVYGDLWTPDRVGEVPPAQRPALRAVASRINRQVFPGGAYAKAVTADQVRAMSPDLTGH